MFGLWNNPNTEKKNTVKARWWTTLMSGERVCLSKFYSHLCATCWTILSLKPQQHPQQHGGHFHTSLWAGFRLQKLWGMEKLSNQLAGCHTTTLMLVSIKLYCINEMERIVLRNMHTHTHTQKKINWNLVWETLIPMLDFRL